MILLWSNKHVLPVAFTATAVSHCCFISVFRFQEYNIYGWWVGELNGALGIVPKDFLHPAYILWAPTGTGVCSYHQHYRPLLRPNTQKTVPVVLILIATEVFSVVDLPFMASVGW